MFTLTVSETFLFEIGWYCDPWLTGSGRVTFSIKNRKTDQLLLELLENWLSYMLSSFEWSLIFLILFNTFGTGKIEKHEFSDSKNFTDFKHE